MIWPRFKTTAPIAIDVGTSALRAIQLERRGDGHAIRHWLNQSLPTAEKEAQGGPDKEGLPGLAHARLANLQPFAGRQVVTLLSPPDVEVCALRVPDKLLSRGTGAVIAGVRHEVARHVSISPETAEIGVWRLPAGQPEGPNVMVAVTPKALIKRLLEWIDAHGCVCVRIDLAPLVMMRACARIMKDLASDRLWGVLDIGLRSTRFYLGIGETPVYIRSLCASGDLMTRRIVNELGVELRMAERYKRHFGIRANGGGYRPMLAEQGPIDANRMSSILLGTLSPIVRGMAQDIEKSFRYAMDLYPGLAVSELVLVGGGSNLDGLPEHLGELLGIKVRRATADPAAIGHSNHPALAEKTLAEMVACLGLSYGEIRR